MCCVLLEGAKMHLACGQVPNTCARDMYLCVWLCSGLLVDVSPCVCARVHAVVPPCANRGVASIMH